MKTKILLAALFATCVLFSSCDSTIDPDDPKRFTTESIVGKWVAVDSTNHVLFYYDIKSDSHLFLMQAVYAERYALYNPEDGCMHTTKDLSWGKAGDIEYLFDQKKQVIRCLSGWVYLIDIKDVLPELGTDEAFDVKRVGLDEAYLYSKIVHKQVLGFFDFTLEDGHMFRIKGIKKDL